MEIYVFFVITFLLLRVVIADYALEAETWTGKLSRDDEIQTKTLAVTHKKYSIIKLDYTIVLANITSFSNSSPYIYFRRHFNASEVLDWENSCLSKKWEQIDPKYLSLSPGKYCRFSQLSLICQGSVQFSSAYPLHWSVIFANSCNNKTSGQYNILEYELALTPYESVTCYKTEDILTQFDVPKLAMPTLLNFFQKVQYYSKFNMIGLEDDFLEKHAYWYPALSAFQSCYMHIHEIVLRINFPECRNGKIIYPCSEMCQEFRAGCLDTYSALQLYTTGCLETFSRSDITHSTSEPLCAYQPIECHDILIVPENGNIIPSANISLHSRRHFQCEEGYSLVGNDTAVCNYGGQWQIESYPQCVEKNETIRFNETVTYNDKIQYDVIISVSVVGSIFIIALIVALVLYTRYRHDVIVILFKFCRCFLCCTRFNRKNEEKLYHAMIAYHDHDLPFIRKEIQGPLEEKGYVLFVEPPLGEPVIRCTADAIAHSHVVIVMLSQQFLDDAECMYMSHQAYYQTLLGEYFEVILLLMEEEKKLEKIPRYLRAFLVAGSNVVKKDNPLMLSQLMLAMPPLPHNVHIMQCFADNTSEAGSTKDASTIEKQCGIQPSEADHSGHDSDSVEALGD